MCDDSALCFAQSPAMDEEWQAASALPTHCDDNSDAIKPAAPIMSRCPAMEQEWQQLLLERLSVDVQGDSVAPAGDLSSCSELTHCSAPAAPSSPLFAGRTSIDGDEPTAEDFAEFRSFMSSEAREKRTSLASEQAADSEPAAAGDENAGSAEKAVSSSTAGGVDNVLAAPADRASGAPQEADSLEQAVILLDAVGPLAQQAMLNVWHRTHIAGSSLPHQGQDSLEQDEQRLTELLAILIEKLPGNAIATVKNIVETSDFSGAQRDVWKQWVDVVATHVFRIRPDEPHCTRKGYFCFAPEQAAEGVKAGSEMDEMERIKLY